MEYLVLTSLHLHLGIRLVKMIDASDREDARRKRQGRPSMDRRRPWKYAHCGKKAYSVRLSLTQEKSSRSPWTTTQKKNKQALFTFTLVSGWQNDRVQAPVKTRGEQHRGDHRQIGDGHENMPWLLTVKKKRTVYIYSLTQEQSSRSPSTTTQMENKQSSCITAAALVTWRDEPGARFISANNTEAGRDMHARA
jgi:hypothetical protein